MPNIVNSFFDLSGILFAEQAKNKHTSSFSQWSCGNRNNKNNNHSSYQCYYIKLHVQWQSILSILPTATMEVEASTKLIKNMHSLF